MTIPHTALRVHPEMLAAFQRLVAKAKQAGFDLQGVSAFRSFSDQLRIWNLKASGKRPVLDAMSNPIDIFSVSSLDLVLAILRWSALPGASRHHWGTDIDVIDAAALPAGYRVQLIPQEVEGQGMFAPLHDWLDLHMQEEGFYRPYDKDRGGVSPERWHLSYYPVAAEYTQKLTEEMVLDAYRDQSLELREVIERNLPQLFHRFVRNVSPAPVV